MHSRLRGKTRGALGLRQRFPVSGSDTRTICVGFVSRRFVARTTSDKWPLGDSNPDAFRHKILSLANGTCKLTGF